MRYELTDDEWTAIKPMLPNKPRGVPRVNDRRSTASRWCTDQNSAAGLAMAPRSATPRRSLWLALMM